MGFRADDLVPLLFPPPSNEVGFHQGTVLTWDSATGVNTVDVGGATLTNVPILNTGEAVALKAGHVVAMIRFKSSFFILGRVTIPGSPDFAAASVAFGRLRSGASNFSISSVAAAKVTGTIPVPAWADEAVVFATAFATVKNSTTGGHYVFLNTEIDGITGAEVFSPTEPNGVLEAWTSLSASDARVLTSLGSVLTLSARMRTSDATFAANASNLCYIIAIAVFRSTV